MDAVSLRRHLVQFLGDEQFRKFVTTLRRAGRLRYWQEQAWDRFVAAHPDYRAPVDVLRDSLRVCEIHGNELLPDEVAVVEGNVDCNERYNRARRDEFPNAAVSPVYTEGAPPAGWTVEAWYCSECREAESRWQDVKVLLGEPSPRDLTRRTTLDEYAVAWGCDALSGEARTRWQSVRADVEGALADGAELWE